MGEVPVQPVRKFGQTVSGIDVLPVSFSQEQLWFFQQLEPDSPAYHISFNVRIKGWLNVEALENSLNEIRRRHDALRTTFADVDGQPMQIIAPMKHLRLPIIDLQGLRGTRREREAERLAGDEARRPFDLGRSPLLRTVLLRLGAKHHILLRTLHHIVCDGWSIDIFTRELAALYEAFSMGKPSPLNELPMQCADFAHWQRQRLQGAVLESQLTYWKRQLGGELAVLALPTDRPRPTLKTYRGARHKIELPASITEALRSLARSQNATLFMTLYAAFTTLLSRYTGQDDIAVGTPVASRHHVQTRGMIGLLINTLVLRSDLSGNPRFCELLARVRETMLEVYAHQDVPLSMLVEELQPARFLDRTPLFQVQLVMEPPMAEEKLAGLVLTPLEVDMGTSAYDLILQIMQKGQGLSCEFRYSTDLFEAATIKRLVECFRTLLDGIVACPEQRLSALPLLTQGEQRQRSIQANPVAPTNPFIEFKKEQIEQSIAARFERQAHHYPGRIAVKTNRYEWSYELLNSAANRLAHLILARCGRGEQRIALLFEHDAPMIAGMLGVLKAGKAYVPLDPSHPRQRLTYMLQDAQVVAVLTNTKSLALAEEITQAGSRIINLDEADSAGFAGDIGIPISPDSLAYILYTSGSTGQPKGVMQNHRNVLYFIRAYTNNLHINADDRLTLFSSYGFDAAVMDIFGALLNGATLCPIDVKAQAPAALGEHLTERGITIYHSTPTLYRYVVGALREKKVLQTIRLVVLGGEEVHKRDVDLYKKYFVPGCLFVNGLGPTESTVSLQYFINKQTKVMHNTVPVGYPVAGSEMLLLDRAGGETEFYGEIAVRSSHVALGYWQQPELTRQAFLPDPQGGDKRIYRTGDMGRLMPDGSIGFAGRKDFQVKIRGYRIELREIELTLAVHPALSACVVTVREDDPGDRRLVAYVVAYPGTAPTADNLRKLLKEKLPEYMVPAAFVVLDELPLTPSRKVDYRALPMPDYTQFESETAFIAPRTPIESMLAEFWGEALKLDKIGIHDNFFELGGHSLLATQVISRIRTAFQIELPLRSLFENPTVAGLGIAIAHSQIEHTVPEEISQMLAELDGLTEEQVQLRFSQ